MRVDGLKRVVEALQARLAKLHKDSDASVVVGFSQEYAIYVHENLEAHHPVGQAKFLETPAKLMRPQLAAGILEDMGRGATLSQALLRAGLKLQREAQLLCPVDTGALKASAYTRLE